MAIVKKIWAEEIARLERIYEAAQKALEKYPKGSIQIKRIKGKEQHYLMWRDGKKIKCKYIGNDPDAIKKAQMGIDARKDREHAQRELLKDIRLLEKALRLKVKGEDKVVTNIKNINESHLLNPETLKYLQKVSKEYGVKKMLLFGSCLHKPEDEAGDIDLAVEGLEGTNIYDFVGELLLAKELKKQVHVVDLSTYTPIVPIVLEEGVIIYEGKG